jgi:hypothetical protein
VTIMMIIAGLLLETVGKTLWKGLGVDLFHFRQ